MPKRWKPTSSQRFDDRTLPPDVHNLSFLTRLEPQDKQNHFKYPVIASEETYWVIDWTETHGKCRNHYLCEGSPSPATNHGDPGWKALFSKVDKEILKELDGSSHWPAPGEDVKAQVRSYADWSASGVPALLHSTRTKKIVVPKTAVSYNPAHIWLLFSRSEGEAMAIVSSLLGYYVEARNQGQCL